MPGVSSLPPAVQVELCASISDPTVSVVMANHNKREYLAGSIESVLAQTMANFELLVVDDASTDDSFEIARRYAERETKITLIRNETRRGAATARNTGIRISRAPIIAFLDSDDVYAPTKLEKQLNLLQRANTPTVVYSDCWRIDERGTILPPTRWNYGESGMIFPDVLADKFGVKMTIMVPRVCFREAGLFDEIFPYYEDLEMVLRLSRRYPFTCIDEKLYGYRIFPGNIRNRLGPVIVNSARGRIFENYYRTFGSSLSPDQRISAILNLTKCFRRSNQRTKMLRYGLSSSTSFKYLFFESYLGKGLRRAIRSAGSQ